MDRFGPMIFSAVARTFRARVPCPREDDIRDATQEVFVRLVKDGFRLLRSYDPSRASLSTWLTIVARSAALDWLRRQRPDAVPLDEAVQVGSVAPELPAARSIEIPPHLLSTRQRLVMHLLFDEDLDVAEVARTLGIGEQTVRSTKHKALVRLRGHFKAVDGS